MKIAFTWKRLTNFPGPGSRYVAHDLRVSEHAKALHLSWVMGNELWSCGLRRYFVKNSRRFMTIKQLCSLPFLFWSLPNLFSCGLYHVPSGHPWCSEIPTGMQVSMERAQWAGACVLHTHPKTFVFCNHWVKFSLCKSLVECTVLSLNFFQRGCQSSTFLPAIWKWQSAVY